MQQTTSDGDKPLAEQFRLEEFKVLRGEIELRATEQRGMERNVILVAAAIYGFLLVPKTGIMAEDQPYLDLAWYLPPLFSFLGLIRWRESVKMIDALAEYLRGVEQKATPDGGWETFLAAQREKGQLPIVSAWYALFWDIVCAGSLVVASLRRPLIVNSAIPMAILLGLVATIVVSMMAMRRRRG